MEEYSQPCNLCKLMTTYQCGNGSKMNHQMIRIGGICTVFIDGFKKYIKRCCLINYYLGNFNRNLYSQQQLCTKIKIKSPKYILCENDKFMVFEINLLNEEIIINPNGHTKDEKLEIFRNFQFIEYDKTYKFITKTIFNKPLVVEKKISPKESECENLEYVYLLQERTAVALNKPIYKIGRTNQPNFERFKGYHKGYKILLHVVCNDCKDIEQKIIDLFITNYNHYTEYGNEYFEGDYKSMIKDIFTLII